MDDPIVQFFESNDVTYEFTANTFKKTSKLPFADKRHDGTDFIWYRPWNHERISNEAKALQLVSKETTIPVPKLLDYGMLEDGRQYLVTQLIDGIRLNEVQNRGCFNVQEKHTTDALCIVCTKHAYSNALKFIEKTVIPQLSKLKSKTRGIDGFVMPPRWICEALEPPWIGKGPWQTLPCDIPEYVFQHGNMAAHNTFVDPVTLQVNSLIDWEFAGFFPPGMEKWPGSLDIRAYRGVAENMPDNIARYLAVEYIECFEAWQDKAQLEQLVQKGEIPSLDHIEKMRKTEYQVDDLLSLSF